MSAEDPPRHHDVEQTTVAFGHPYAAAAAAHAKAQAKEVETSLSPQAEKILPKDKEKPSLGELNPLIHPPDFSKKGVIDSLSEVSRSYIEGHDLIQPISIGAVDVTSVGENQKALPRFIARFETPSISKETVVQLENLVKARYSENVMTTKNLEGKDVDALPYPRIDGKAQMHINGWYFGPSLTGFNGLTSGLYVYENRGKTTLASLSNEDKSEKKCTVEIREGEMYQADLVEFVIQTASILTNNKMLDRGSVLHEVYYDLMRLGLKEGDGVSLFGLDEQHAIINRSLIYPLANKRIREGLEQYPESVMLVGVPGTGKTLLAEKIIRERPDVFILPFDPLDLAKEMVMEKERQKLMPRVDEIARITGKDIVFHIDDIENMVDEDEKTNSTILNLMQGLKDNGFYLISSTNDPEKIPVALKQPQRLGLPVHCPLQDKKSRFEILKIHAGSTSSRSSYPLFPTDESRVAVLTDIAERTDGYTPRYLAQVANVAKSFFLERIVKEERRTSGLQEDDLIKYRFSLDDWKKAFFFVDQRYDCKSMRDKDRRLAEVVQGMKAGYTGFSPNRTIESSDVFTSETINLFTSE